MELLEVEWYMMLGGHMYNQIHHSMAAHKRNMWENNFENIKRTHIAESTLFQTKQKPTQCMTRVIPKLVEVTESYMERRGKVSAPNSVT